MSTAIQLIPYSADIIGCGAGASGDANALGGIVKMATEKVQIESNASRLIQIPTTKVLPEVQPIVPIGELVNFLVKSNADGVGQLYINGLLIPAKLPQNLEAGDRVLAKVVESSQNQLVLKLVESSKTPASLKNGDGVSGKLETVEERIANLLKEYIQDKDGGPNLTPPKALGLPIILQNTKMTEVTQKNPASPQLVGGQYGGQPGTPSAELVKPLLTELVNKSEAVITASNKTLISGTQKEVSGQTKEVAAKGDGLNLGPLQNFLNPLNAEENLAHGDGAYSQLLESTTGALTQNLREAAKAVRGAIPEAPYSRQEKFLSFLLTELRNVLDNWRTNPNMDQLRSQLDPLLRAIADETKTLVKQNTDKGKDDAASLRHIMDGLKQLQDNPSGATDKLEQLLNQLSTLAPNVKPELQQLDPGTQQELKQVAAQLDQLAATQEKLNKLNPLMHALGEPALILLPFVLQGLLTHSEVSVESRWGKGNKKEGNGKRGGSKKAPYQRVQVTVPLPSIGEVDVDIAHREQEIMVRFTVENPKVGAFLIEQLEELANTLKGLNFSQTELITHVGVRSHHLPLWTLSLGATRSIVA